MPATSVKPSSTSTMTALIYSLMTFFIPWANYSFKDSPKASSALKFLIYRMMFMRIFIDMSLHTTTGSKCSITLSLHFSGRCKCSVISALIFLISCYLPPSGSNSFLKTSSILLKKSGRSKSPLKRAIPSPIVKTCYNLCMKGSKGLSGSSYFYSSGC